MTAPIIRTVLGDRPASDFRAVAVHEHLLYDIAPPAWRGDPGEPVTMVTRWQADYRSNENPANARQTDRRIAAGELAAFAAEVDADGLRADRPGGQQHAEAEKRRKQMPVRTHCQDP